MQNWNSALKISKGINIFFLRFHPAVVVMEYFTSLDLKLFPCMPCFQKARTLSWRHTVSRGSKRPTLPTIQFEFTNSHLSIKWVPLVDTQPVFSVHVLDYFLNNPPLPLFMYTDSKTHHSSKSYQQIRCQSQNWAQTPASCWTSICPGG